MKLTNQIVQLRQQICPRTSYASAGSAASTIFFFTHSNSSSSTSTTTTEFMNTIEKEILSTKEFEHILYFNILEELIMKLQGNVILVIEPPTPLRLSDWQGLLLQRKTKLILFLTSSVSSNEIHNLEKITSANHLSLSKTQHDHHWLLAVYLSQESIALLNQSSSSSSASLKAFNGQPSVQSKQQFKYLWENNALDGRAEAKERVLQRLADRETYEKKKHPKAFWNSLITTDLTQNKDDWQIYSHLRHVFLGHTLEEDLQRSTTIPCPGGECDHKHNKEAEETEGKGEEGRASHLVDLTISTLPRHLMEKGRIKRLLDYGCAEGDITAELGKRLGLAEDSIFGADVRAITANKGYTFLQLPSEMSDESHEDILPQIPDGSIDVINAAMVFHHVTHVAAAIRTLRRKVSSEGVLIIREHDCHTPGMGAMLDITHGLYSLVWSSPIEWPDFVNEYQAFYRNREQWSEVIAQCGFRRFEEPTNEMAVKQFNSAMSSVMNNRSGRFPNVIRAYYAVYVPNPAYRLSVTPRCVVDSKDDVNPVKKRVRLDVAAPECPCQTSQQKALICESKTHPGRFYRYDFQAGQAEWIG